MSALSLLESKHGKKFRDAEVVSSALYPKVFDEYQEFVKTYGDVSILPTPNYFQGALPGEEIVVNMAGREVNVKHVVKSHVNDDGSRDVFFEVMGYPRTVNVQEKTASKERVQGNRKNLQADANDPRQLGAPMPGVILNYKVPEGTTVSKGQPLVILGAMKMETVVVAPRAGVILSIPLKDGDNVQVGDLLLTLA